jgi:hypothetical protein
MLTTDSGGRRQAIRRALTQRAGSEPDASSIAQAAVEMWHGMAAQLAPVIGSRGLDVLFSRALHKSRTSFPWLGVAVDRGGSVGPLPSLGACLASQHTAAAAEASYVLLSTFAELLETLIGESLTERLLASVWASPSRPSGQESAL